MQRAVAVAKTNRIDIEDLPPDVLQVIPFVPSQGTPGLIRDVEKNCILSALEKTQGNRREAAELMGMGVATLYRKLKSYKREKVEA
jgi:transcriptional regulator of acetoin/glycerol metabolism